MFLYKNQLTGSIPEWVLQHEKLEYLCLDDNGFTGNLAREIRAVNLILLNLSGNQLTGEIPQLRKALET
jgi:hypothetical protein